MKYPPTTIPVLPHRGYENNTSGIVASTKRNGKWIDTTIDEFKEKVTHLALGLYDLGIRKGDRIAIHSENCTEWLICDQAVLSIGAILVPIYTTQPADQIKFITEDAETKLYIFSQDKLFDPNAEAIRSSKPIEAIYSILPSKHKDVKSLDILFNKGAELNKAKPELYQSLLDELSPDDLCTFMYTSGTTGMPKGVMLTHNNIGSNIVRIVDYIPFDLKKHVGKPVISFLPLSHSFERAVANAWLHIGMPIYFIEVVEDIKEDLQTIKPIYFSTVPRLLEKLHAGIKGKANEISGVKKVLFDWAIRISEDYDVAHPPKGLDAFFHRLADKLIYSKFREAMGGNLHGVISGGAALSSEIMNFMNCIGIQANQGYGLTETSPVLAVMKPDELRPGTPGKAFTDVQLKIDEDGEILAKGPNIMVGYYNQPEKTAEVFTEDGWFRTGDIGKIDKDGYLYITDRKKALFKLSTGKYVAPQHIENLLVNSMFVEQSMVIGNSRKFCAALIIPDYQNVRNFLHISSSVSNEEMKTDQRVIDLFNKEVEKVNKTLPKWEQVKKFVLLEHPFAIETGELTPTLKIKRNIVSKKFNADIEALYA